MAGGKNIYSPEARQAQRFEFKAGVNGFQWKGHVLEGDPSSLPANRPRLLVNTRLSGGIIKNRAGMSDYSSGTDTVPGCVVALNETDSNIRLYYGFVGCGALAGGTLVCINQDEFVETRSLGAYYSSNDTVIRIAEHGGSVFLGMLGRLKKFADGVDVPTSDGDVYKDLLVKDFTGTASTRNLISMLQSYEGDLYIGITPAAGNATIWKYDGVSMVSDLSVADIPKASCLWREYMVVGQNAAANRIRYRNSSGTWTTVAPGAGTVQVYPGGNAMVSYKDVVYMAEGPEGAGTARIWSYDGTTLQVARTPAGATFLPVLAVMNDYLYYGYITAGNVYIGRFDGTTWSDTHKDLRAQFSNARYILGLAEFRGQLYAGLNTNTVVASPGFDTSGTWIGSNPTDTTTAKTAHNFVVI